MATQRAKARREKLLQELRSLADNPAAQSECAVQLLQTRNGLEVVRAALAVLKARPYPPALAALTALYEHYAAAGISRDAGTYMRSDILRALRPICDRAQLPLLESALLTYEFPPPAFREEAGLLRSVALVIVAELDEAPARYHAVRLLADPLTDPMSGEPALTAVEALAAQGELTPLYFYVCQGDAQWHPEVAGAALRGLREVPEEGLRPLLVQLATCEQPVVLVGMVDMLMAHAGAPFALDTMAELLARTEEMDLYRYVAATLMAAGEAAWQTLLLTHARGEEDPEKCAVLCDVLAPAAETEAVADLLASLRRRS